MHSPSDWTTVFKSTFLINIWVQWQIKLFDVKLSPKESQFKNTYWLTNSLGYCWECVPMRVCSGSGPVFSITEYGLLSYLIWNVVAVAVGAWLTASHELMSSCEGGSKILKRVFYMCSLSCQRAFGLSWVNVEAGNVRHGQKKYEIMKLLDVVMGLWCVINPGLMVVDVWIRRDTA